MSITVGDDETKPSRSIARNDSQGGAGPLEVITRPFLVEGDPILDRSNSPGVNVSLFLHALRRKWLLGVIAGCFCAVPLATVAWFVLEPQYKATALVRISPQHVPLLFETADRTGPSGRLDFKNFKSTQRQLILAPQLLNSSLKRGGISELPVIRDEIDPIAWLQKNLEIKFPDDAEIMHVSLALPDGKSAQKIVDAVIGAYNEDVVLAEQNERMLRVDNLVGAKIEAESKARTKRAELRGLVDTLGSTDTLTLNLAQQAAVQQYSLIRTELTKTQFEIMRAEGELQVGSRRQEKNVDEPDSSSQNDTANFNSSDIREDGPRTPQLEAKPSDFQPIRDFRVNELMEKDPVGARYSREVQRYSDLIEQAEKRLDSETAAHYTAQYRERLDHAQQKVSERTAQLQEVVMSSQSKSGAGSFRNLPLEVEILRTQERRLQEELKRQEAEGKKIGRSSIDVEMMLKEVEGLDKVVSGIAEELERTKIELKSNSRITVLGPAQIPQLGESKKRLPLTAAIGGFGFFAPLLLLIAFDLRRQLVNGSQTMSDLMKMPVLGSLPLVPRRIMRQIGSPRNAQTSLWHRRLSESVASMTSLLLHKLDLEGHRVVLITSAISGEGKSTLAQQLASSLAESGHRTLLIDFDLRRPTLHDKFKVPVGPGVAEVLKESVELDQVVHQELSPNLSLLTAGSYSVSLLKAASCGALRSLFTLARSNYEIVIVDSCPLLPVMDGRLIGQQTDGAILSVIKDYSTVPNLVSARSILDDYGIPALGCVVTGHSGDSYYATYGRNYSTSH